jgi:hypothetical protein
MERNVSRPAANIAIYEDTVKFEDRMNNSKTPYFGAIPGLLGVSSIGASFRGFIYGSPGDHDEEQDPHYPLRIHIGSYGGTLFHPSSVEPGFLDFGRYSLKLERQEIRYSRKLFFNQHAQYILKRESDGFCLTYNSTYERYSELILTMHPVPDLLASIFTYYLLLSQNYLSLHCSAVSNQDDNNTLIFALPDTGKT